MTTPTAAAFPSPATSELDPRFDAPATAVDTVPPRSIVERFVDRFVLIAFGLYHLPLLLNNYPSLGGGGFNDTGLAVKWGHVFTVPGLWVARHVLGVTGPMPTGRSGDNGDVAEEFARLLLSVVIGIVAAAIWTAVDRNRPRGGWVRETIRVLLRYSIALGLTSYAVAKLLPMQFPPITPLTLEQRVGELRPMSLLWTFMQYSRPYAFFGGLMEMVVVLLLCWRRTATLGAIVCLAVMANVAALNLAYDVPVKLYSTMTVVTALVLALYDFPRLTAFFLANRTAPPQEGSFIHRRVPLVARWAVKILVVGSVIASSVVAMRTAIAGRVTALRLNGPWEVTSFLRNGARIDSTADPLRWRRAFIDENSIVIRMESDSLIGCRRTPLGGTNIGLTCNSGHRGMIQWLRDGNIVWFYGTFDQQPVRISIRQMDSTNHRLIKGGFRWITDR